MNILIVDDDATSRFVLSACLKKLGHNVTSAKNGAEAFKLFTEHPVPLVISDILMPEMDGLELCRQVRAVQRSQYTFIILLTQLDGKSGYLDGMRAGADDFISKPLDSEILAARLAVAERILSLQTQLKQLAGLLPICCLCKKVRDDQNYWHEVESFVSRHSEATFTHSYCPDCFNKMMKEIDDAQASPG